MSEKENLKLKSLRLSGFKSIADQNNSQIIEFHQNSTVAIGANGSSKSNLVSFFKMLGMIMTGALRTYIGKYGGADSILHYGAKQTTQIEANLQFAQGDNVDSYRFVLAHASSDTLIFTHEILDWLKDHSLSESWEKNIFGGGT